MKAKISEILSQDDFENYASEFEVEDHISRYHKAESADILTLRGLEIDHESLRTKSQNFILQDDKVYHCSSGDSACILLGNGHDELLDQIEWILEKNNEILKIYSEQIDLLEDYVYDRQVPRHFMDMWFDIKKSILKIERYYSRLIPILRNYWKEYSSKLIDSFEGALEQMQFNLSQTNGLISKLETIHHYYSSVKNDKLNKNIYLLTLISGAFLPLNLIVGFFGMNTENLIFKDNPEGTMYVVYVLGGVLLFFTVGFRIIKIFDKLLLRYVLGRYRFYQALSKRLQSMNKTFDID